MTEIGYLGDVSIYKVQARQRPRHEGAAVNRTRLAEPPIGTGDRVWLILAPEAGVVLTR